MLLGSVLNICNEFGVTSEHSKIGFKVYFNLNALNKPVHLIYPKKFDSEILKNSSFLNIFTLPEPNNDSEGNKAEYFTIV